MMVKFAVVLLCVDWSDITGHEAGDICGFCYYMEAAINRLVCYVGTSWVWDEMRKSAIFIWSTLKI